MSTDWAWAESVREKHFGEPLAGKYPIETLGGDAYWALHEAEMRRYFPREFYFGLQAMLGEEQKSARARIEESPGMSGRLSDHWVAKDGDTIVAMFSGHPRDADTYRMWHTNIHPDYRRQGIYSEIVRRYIDYTRELGFSFIVSEHAVSNNPILIAKLKAGFRIMGMDIDAGIGPSILLKYFHDEAHLRAYEFRCGLATLDKKLLGASFGAMNLLVEQIKSGADGER